MSLKVCLITGGGGFLGRIYCDFFLKNNYNVLCIDNNKKNLEKIKSVYLKNLEIYDCDITNHDKVEKLFYKIKKKIQSMF